MIEVRRLGEQIGAEIHGVDVRKLDDAGFAAIYRAWLDSNVLVVPGQQLEIQDFLRYSRRFGVVHPHPSKMTRHPDYPEITLLGVNKFGADGQLDQAIYRRGAEGWHTDGAYDEEPFKATQLYALAVPSAGGDTFFASMYAAYEALPPRLKQRLEGRKGAFTYGGRRKATALLNEEDRDWTPVFHPIIRTHPVPQSLWQAVDAGKEWYGYRHEPGQGLGVMVGNAKRTAFSSPKVRFTTDERLKDMDAQGVDVQVLSIHTPFFGYHLDPAQGRQLAREVNDEIAGLTRQSPQRFAGLATLPVQDVKAAIDELERAVTVLGLKGAELDTVVNGENWDEPKFLPLFKA